MRYDVHCALFLTMLAFGMAWPPSSVHQSAQSLRCSAIILLNQMVPPPYRQRDLDCVVLMSQEILPMSIVLKLNLDIINTDKANDRIS